LLNWNSASARCIVGKIIPGNPNWFATALILQAGEIALKFEPDRAQKVIQLVGPRLVEIGRCNPVSLHLLHLYTL